VTLNHHTILAGSALSLLFACAHAAPVELLEARSTYDRAAAGPSKKYTPAELHIAKQSLTEAEQRFADDGDTALVRDQAYIARRKTELAEALARTEMSRRGIAISDKQEDQLEKKDAARTKSELADAKGALAAEKSAGAANEKELGAERQRRADAEQRAAQATASLQRIASVKQEDRGTVITLSGSVLFASNKHALLPSAQAKLSQVADALLKGDPEARFVVEGHTDSQGKAGANQELSLRRSNSVRNDLIMHGIAADRIVAEGHGSTRAIGDNKTAEGRANNRRVEIIVTPKTPH